MTTPPEYFERVRARASGQWEKLESDPELAGPWHQLFQQVQSPRHVLSELLQNADDAGATEAAVTIQDGALIFSHDGRDFDEEEFASLCRFGYSNKRVLHTIGFRGVGFKSTFSLGPRVELRSPTLTVAFHHEHFTEPVWIADAVTDGKTVFRVPIADTHRSRELEKNLAEWATSPLSLLFFRTIRRLRVLGENLAWVELGEGPIPGSSWMALESEPDDVLLLIRSQPDSFPEDAQAEVRRERMLGIGDEDDLPPCQIELVVGVSGRLYVVLPTGVETQLPFACNAPFIQDPARLKIKDSETSPTNRWLLQRVGQLAANAMLEWLAKESLDREQRASAYDLFPDVDRSDTSLEGSCATVVEEAFDDALEGSAFLLLETGALGESNQGIALPAITLDTWPPEQASALLDDQGRPAFSRAVSPKNRRKLLNWGVLVELSKAELLTILEQKHLPKPRSKRQLLSLWTYLAPEIVGYEISRRKDRLRIVPVMGKNILYSSKEVVRLGDKRLLSSDDDWEFLSEHLLVLDRSWPRYLVRLRQSEDDERDSRARPSEKSLAVLRELRLDQASDAAKVLDRVAANFFSGAETKSISECVRMAQIAARLGAPAGGSFRFVTRDGRMRTRDDAVFDASGDLDLLLPEGWCAEHLLHDEYLREFTSCNREEWSRWVSGSSGLSDFVRLREFEREIWGREDISREIAIRGGQYSPYFRYKTHQFILQDWDFPLEAWQHWESTALQDECLWVHVVERLLAQGQKHRAKARSARALQIATTGRRKAITSEELVTQWILRLRELPCLPDTQGRPRRPDELLRRTAATEPLLDVEPFVHRDLDTEGNSELLELLGVRDTPTGVDRILDRVRALAKSATSPASEVEKWYRRLDQLYEHADTTDTAVVRRAFQEERLILNEDGEWTTSRGVFQVADEEDVPGARVLRPAVRDFSLWRRIGLAERPTPELAIEWLRSLPTDEPLPAGELRRVQALLARHPLLVWRRVGRWLSLSGKLVPVDSLRFGLSMQSLVPWSHLHAWVRRQTADLRKLSRETVDAAPFSALTPLGGALEMRLRKPPGVKGAEDKPWLAQLGSELRRVRLNDLAEAERIRQLAEDLSATSWQTASPLEVTPYLDGKPAGTVRPVDVIWEDRVLYVEPRPLARLARSVAEEIGRFFVRPEIVDAIKVCFERPPGFITEYLEENLDLVARDAPELGKLDRGHDAVPKNDQDVDGEANGTTLPTDGERFGGVIAVGEDKAVQTDETFGGEPLEARPEADATTAPVRPQESPPNRQPRRRPIVERFAQAQGFKADGDGRFYSDDGSWIAKLHDAGFPWEHRTATGKLVRYYWPADHCLERKPLQIDADVWALIERSPELYSLILTDPEGRAVEVSGHRLRELQESGLITLHPATYRLVYGAS